mmetsp:Transcript_25108/g.58206  ORF Transcript_25108/g.58206 Transcript_25108/m.58206 type:complete len:85 (+) Transcript_25108:908-1162(+)
MVGLRDVVRPNFQSPSVATNPLKAAQNGAARAFGKIGVCILLCCESSGLSIVHAAVNCLIQCRRGKPSRVLLSGLCVCFPGFLF